MTGLLDVPGHYRNAGVGVMAGEQVIHMAPPANRVPLLMQDLLHWLKITQDHPLIASSVFTTNLSSSTLLQTAMAVWGDCGKL